VQGRTFTDKQLDIYEQRMGKTFSEKQRKVYKTIGGTPHLDGTYTVFGEVLEGMEVVDKIAAVKTGKGNKPVKDIVINEVKILQD
jgi:peptidyl-prolyl cis-trans isomerase B (cyclophilin B)